MGINIPCSLVSGPLLYLYLLNMPWFWTFPLRPQRWIQERFSLNGLIRDLLWLLYPVVEKSTYILQAERNVWHLATVCKIPLWIRLSGLHQIVGSGRQQLVASAWPCDTIYEIKWSLFRTFVIRRGPNPANWIVLYSKKETLILGGRCWKTRDDSILTHPEVTAISSTTKERH